MTGHIWQGSDEQKEQGRQILVEVLEAVRIVAVLLSPVTPTLAKAAFAQLGFPAETFISLQLSDLEWGGELSTPFHAALSITHVSNQHIF